MANENEKLKIIFNLPILSSKQGTKHTNNDNISSTVLDIFDRKQKRTITSMSCFSVELATQVACANAHWKWKYASSFIPNYAHKGKKGNRRGNSRPVLLKLNKEGSARKNGNGTERASHIERAVLLFFSHW
jgi:hypothetical protein